MRKVILFSLLLLGGAVSAQNISKDQQYIRSVSLRDGSDSVHSWIKTNDSKSLAISKMTAEQQELVLVLVRYQSRSFTTLPALLRQEDNSIDESTELDEVPASVQKDSITLSSGVDICKGNDPVMDIFGGHVSK